MTSETRSADRNDLDSLTQDFLAKGGKIEKCPPGASENVVYKRTAFRRRNAAEAKPDTPAATPDAAQATKDPAA